MVPCALCGEILDCCTCWAGEDDWRIDSEWFKLLVGDIEDD